LANISVRFRFGSIHWRTMKAGKGGCGTLKKKKVSHPKKKGAKWGMSRGPCCCYQTLLAACDFLADGNQ